MYCTVISLGSVWLLFSLYTLPDMLYSDQPGFSLVIVFPVGSAWCVVQWSAWVQSGYCFLCRVCLICCTVISLGSGWSLFFLYSLPDMLYSDQPGFSLVIVSPVGSAWCVVQWSAWVQSGYCLPCRVCLTCWTVINLGSVWWLLMLYSPCRVCLTYLQWSAWVQSGYCIPCRICLMCCTVISLGSVWLLFSL